MNSVGGAQTPEVEHAGGWRDRLAALAGVRPEQKEAIYLQIARSASLKDASYWLQILFSAGIATLGLVLDSPAVIIGAMLISPMMGPILANGLALAAGDFVLGVRAIINLTLSCLVAVSFAVLLVALLPFKEVTSEIAARTHPNTLDLVIALFSGAVGSVATCKEAKGVVTSIPGVAIAVALMPPLCVVGYGLGVAASLDPAEGLPLARGGGLLFLTNLVAITFTAMIVFLALHIDTPRVKERVREWRREDGESRVVRGLLRRLPAFERLRVIGSLPGRFLLILFVLSLILVPLSRSFTQLRREVERKQEENRVKRVATEVWDENFSKLPGGGPRSYLGNLSVLDEGDGRLSLLLRVFTSRAFGDAEKARYTRLVASRLGRLASSLSLQLIEIPTATSEILTKAREGVGGAGRATPTPAPTLPQLRAGYERAVEDALGGLRLPPPAALLDYEVAADSGGQTRVRLSYLDDHEIGADAQGLIAGDVRDLLDSPDAPVEFEWVAASWGPLMFRRNQTTVAGADADLLDRLGRTLQQHAQLRVEIVGGEAKGERGGTGEARARAVADYLSTNFRIAPGRMTEGAVADERRGTTLTVKSAKE